MPSASTCLSREVKPGKIHGFRYLNGKVVVYRDRDGNASVLSAYCRHLGVDLSEGTVVGGHIRCPYHHWEYDDTGQCVKTAVGAEPPPRAKLFEFPTAEQLGLIWAYNGQAPAYDLPAFPVPEEELDYVVSRSVELPMDPFMLFSNTMDLQHLISLHKAEFDEIPTEFDIRERTISYTQAMKTHIRAVDAFGKRLNAEDDPSFRTISPRMDRLAGGADKALKMYFDFATNYPRTAVAEDLIRNDYLETARNPSLLATDRDR